MKVQELIESLQELNPNSEIRLACQPNWPFEYSIAGVVADNILDSHDEDDDDVPEVAWIVEGRELGYANSEIFKLV